MYHTQVYGRKILYQKCNDNIVVKFVFLGTEFYLSMKEHVVSLKNRIYQNCGQTYRSEEIVSVAL